MGGARGFAALVAAVLLAAVPGLALADGLPAGLRTQVTDGGLTLAQADGGLLYRLDVDRFHKRRTVFNRMIDARCEAVCDRLWRPAPAPAGFAPVGDWGVARRADGLAQLTYKGDPLYSFRGKSLEEAVHADVAPPYMTGYTGEPTAFDEGVPRNTVYWHPALYTPVAPKLPTPSGVRLKWSKAAYVFADAAGRELYVRSGDCAAACDGLKALPAPFAALAVGPWRPVQSRDEGRVWSYRGRVVYQAQEAAPGAGWRPLEAQ